MRANGNAESTIESTIRRLKFLGKNTNLGIPQICKDYITNYNASNSYKEGLAMAYNRYTVCFKLKWEIPYFQKDERLPNVPSVEEANIIISSFSRKWATIFSLLKETGLRPIELHKTTLKNIDLEKGIINFDLIRESTLLNVLIWEGMTAEEMANLTVSKPEEP